MKDKKGQGQTKPLLFPIQNIDLTLSNWTKSIDQLYKNKRRRVHFVASRSEWERERDGQEDRESKWKVVERWKRDKSVSDDHDYWYYYIATHSLFASNDTEHWFHLKVLKIRLVGVKR